MLSNLSESMSKTIEYNIKRSGLQFTPHHSLTFHNICHSHHTSAINRTTDNAVPLASLYSPMIEGISVVYTT